MGTVCASALDVRRVGAGPPVVLVNGSIVGAERTWREQLPLAELLGDQRRLVGHSYGAVIALHAAALRPAAVWSLTISEPGCLSVAAGDPRVDAMIADGNRLFAWAPESSERELLALFRSGVGSTHRTPEDLALARRRSRNS